MAQALRLPVGNEQSVVQRLDVERLQAYVEEQMVRFNVPALEVVVVARGDVLFAGGFGKRDVERDLPVTTRTVFSHGSTGKAFTGFLAATLVEDGLLEWDRPVREYLPDFRMHDDVATARVTLRDLLSHRTGLPGHELSWLANPNLPRAEFVRRLRYLPASKDLRQLFQYCNLGYVTAGYLCGVVTGSSYEEQLRKRIFEPLGMKGTYLDVAEVERLDDFATGYVEREGRLTPIKHRPTEQIAPAGGIHSCAEDTARWLLVQLGKGAIGDTRLLSEELHRETHTVQMSFAGWPVPADTTLRMHGYGLGWGIATYRGHHHLSHSGGIDGFSTEFELVPDAGIGVAACANRQGGLPAAICRHLIDELLGLEPRDWASETNQPAKPAADPDANRGDAAENAAEAEKQEPIPPPSRRLEDFAGEYQHPGYGWLSVQAGADGLEVMLGEAQLKATHRHHDVWDLELPGAEMLPANVAFHTAADGMVTALCSLEPALPPLEFKLDG